MTKTLSESFSVIDVVQSPFLVTDVFQSPMALGGCTCKLCKGLLVCLGSGQEVPMAILGEFTDCSLYTCKIQFDSIVIGISCNCKKVNKYSKIGNQKEHNSIPPLIMKNEVIIESVSRKGESISEMEKCCLLSYWLLSIVCAGRQKM